VIFRILGPLEVTGSPALGGPKQRALLVLLVLRAGETIARDAIVEHVWGSTAPETVAHAVQVYVSRLRKALAGTSAAIQSDAGGYRLDVDPDAIDARVFASLVAQGRTTLAQGDAAAAITLLAQALALWRGPALADFRYEPFAQSEIARLEELRLSATEELIEAQLRLGRHAEVVPELERLVNDEPLRERLRAQLMLALYRAGRQADALAAYRDGARILRDELGLDPGPELRTLEAAILGHDAQLAPRSPRTRLPSPATPLVGRGAQVAELMKLLRGDPRLVTLTGAGGIGKTRLALETAWRLVDSFPDGAHFAGLASVADPDLVALTIAQVITADHGGNDPLEAAIEEVGDGRVLLLVDNFEHVIGAAPVLTRLLSSCPGLKVLATSRSALRLYGETEYDVPSLQEAEAIELFATRASAVRRGLALSASEARAVGELCRRLDGLPLAIELAAAQARVLSPGEMLSALPSRLELAADGPRDVPERQQTLRATIEWSYDLLAEAAATAFRRLGVFAGGWELDAAEAVARAGHTDLGVLMQQSLIYRSHGSARLRILTTIREYALERLEASGEGEEIRRCHAEHFLELAERCDHRLRTGDDQREVLDELERELDNLRAALDWAHEQDAAIELRLAGALGSFWAVRGHATEGRLRLGLALTQPAQDDAAQARALASACLLARSQTDHAAAVPLGERAVALYRRLGDRSGIVRAVMNLGFAKHALGDMEGARASYEEGLEATLASGNRRDRTLMMSCLADLALRDGDYARADELARAALEIAYEIGDSESVAVSLMNRTHSAVGAGRMDDALRFGIESLEAWAAIRDEGSGAWSLDAIAAALAEQRPDTAARLLGAVGTIRARAGFGLDEFELMVRQSAERGVRAQLAEAEVREALAAGAVMSFEEARRVALEAAAVASTERPRRRAAAARQARLRDGAQ
jgi:predicted ATPase/DNA-binding SARP family transcriptional activator